MSRVTPSGIINTDNNKNNNGDHKGNSDQISLEMTKKRPSVVIRKVEFRQ